MSLTEFTGLTSFGTGLNVALTGTPTAPTNTNLYDSSNQIATDAFVQNALGALSLSYTQNSTNIIITLTT